MTNTPQTNKTNEPDEFAEIFASVFGSEDYSVSSDASAIPAKSPEEAKTVREEVAPGSTAKDAPEDLSSLVNSVVAGIHVPGTKSAVKPTAVSEPTVVSKDFSDSTRAEEETPAAEEEVAFDSRFHIGGRKAHAANYSYNGHIVNAGADADYQGHTSPDYAELHSSYADSDTSPEDEEAAPQKKSVLSFLHKKSKAVPQFEEPLPAGEESAEDVPYAEEEAEATDVAFDENDADMGESDSSTSEGKKSVFSISDLKPSFPKFHGKKKKADTDTPMKAAQPDDLDFDDEAIREQVDEEGITPSSFGSFVASEIAGLVFKLRGTVQPGTVNHTMSEDSDDLGQEVTTLYASKYYGSYLYSLKLRSRFSLFVLLVIIWISVGLPVPGMLNAPRVAVATVLCGQLVISVLALDVIATAFQNMLHRRFGADALAVLSCVFTFIDAIAVLNISGASMHLPLCAVSSTSLVGILFASLFSARGLRKALRVPSIAKRTFAVTAETGVLGGDITLLKSSRPATGFVRRAEEEAPDESLFRRIGLFLLPIALILSLFIVIIKKSPSYFLFIFSAIFAAGVPFSALLSFSLPYMMGSMRIFSSGAALAGWSGICDIGQSKNLIVTDRDLFPPSCIEIENARIFADYDSGKVITYAGSLLIHAECGLVPAFSRLMQENGCQPQEVLNFEVMAGGGFKGMMDGHIIVCGNSDLMRLLNVKIPFRLLNSTSVLLAIDGVLYGIFNVKYTPDDSVRKALVSLMNSNRHPVFATRDFNVSPEMIRSVYDVATDGYDFPPYTERYSLSQAKPSGKSMISAVVCKEGLGPLIAMADTGRSVYTVSRINTIISLVAAVFGVFYAFFRLAIAGTVTAGNLLLVMLLFALPVLILGVLARSVG